MLRFTLLPLPSLTLLSFLGCGADANDAVAEAGIALGFICEHHGDVVVGGPVTGVCDGDCVSSVVTDADAAVDLVVVVAENTGSVDGGDLGGGENGHVIVDVRRERPVRLVLSSFEATTWTIEASPATQIVDVTVESGLWSAVDGLDESVPQRVHASTCYVIDDFFFPLAGTCTHRQLPNLDFDNSSTTGFISELEDESCLPLKVFVGVSGGDVVIE